MMQRGGNRARIARNRVVARELGAVAKERSAEVGAHVLPARLLHLRVVRRELGAGVKLVVVHVLERCVCAERHHHVEEETDALLVAGVDELLQVAVRGGRDVAHGQPEVEVRCEVIAGGVTPLAIDEAICNRQQLQCVNAELLQVAAADR
jgi:hypothetical protein